MRVPQWAAVAAFVLMSPAAEAYSGFVRAPGSGYAKLSYGTFTSKDLYLTSGERTSFGSEFSQQSLSLYAEVGVLDWLTVGVNAPVLRMNAFATSRTATGFGDLAIFAKGGLTWEDFHFALMLEPKFPTGRKEFEVATDFEGIRTNLPTGDGEFSMWTRVAVSRSLPTPNPVPAYASIYAGYNLRAVYSDQVEVGGSLGFSVLGWAGLEGRLVARFTPTAVQDLVPQGVFLYGEGTEYVAVGGTLWAKVPSTPASLTLDLWHTFANLKNLYGGTTVAGGVAVQW